MIPMPSGVRVWIATGHTDMRRGMQGLALQVQEQLKREYATGAVELFQSMVEHRPGRPWSQRHEWQSSPRLSWSPHVEVE